jgi:hypothetical protein
MFLYLGSLGKITLKPEMVLSIESVRKNVLFVDYSPQGKIVRETISQGTIVIRTIK